MQEEKLKKLLSSGYSKTKSLQALKDAGGDCSVALRRLEKQKQQQQQQQQRYPGTAKGTVVVPLPKAKETVADPVAENVRKHPCIVQHKTCALGKNCLLRDLPGDACIHYFRGCCLYGSFCKKRHYVDDVNLSEIRARLMNGTPKLPIGVIVQESESSGDDVLLAKTLGKACEVTPPETPEFMPPPSHFNLIRGSDPTHTDFSPLEWQEQRSSVSVKNAPKPFLEAARMNQSEKPREGHPQKTVYSHSFSSPPTGAASRRAKHPCIAQFGSCKFGNECIHSDRDADVCVLFLNNRCNRGLSCKYRHETEEEFLQQFRLRTGVLAVQVKDTVTQKKDKGAQEREGDDGEREGCIEEEGNDVVEEDGEGVLSPWERQPKGVLLSSFLPRMRSDEDLQSDGVETRQHEWWEKDKNKDGENRPCDDMELEALIRFLEAFPDVEPRLLLQVLRSADGDANYAADTLSKLGAFETTEDIEAFLLSKRAEELELLQETEVQSKHECFITLCTLFPAVDTPSIEAVLERCGGDYAEAYGTLLCSTENVTRQDYGNFWNGPIKVADEMRLQKLCTMFPTIPQEVTRTAFGAAEKDFAKTVAALNEMTADLLHFESEAIASSSGAARTTKAGRVNRSENPSPEELLPQLLQRSATREEVEKFCAEVEDELHQMGDWRRVRERAYIVNSCRLQVLARATAAYVRGDGKTAKALSRHGKQLGAEYARLNRISMVALEREQLARDPVSTLDLHGFHVDEVVEVLRRRVQLCVQKGIRRLTVVVGRGQHSRRGYSTVYPAVLNQLKHDPQFQGVVHVKSIKPAFFETIITTKG